MVLSTTVLEPKRNPRNVPRKGLGSGPRIPSKPLNAGQRSREITKRLYGRGQSQRSCHPGPEENRSREHLSSIQRTPGLQCRASLLQNRTPGRKTQTQFNLQCATMVPTWLTTRRAAGTAVILPGLVIPYSLVGRPGSPWHSTWPCASLSRTLSRLPTARL